MKPHVHRTPEIKAQRMAAMVKSPADLHRLLRQFSPDHHAGLIERLKPHLDFDPGQPDADEGARASSTELNCDAP